MGASSFCRPPRPNRRNPCKPTTAVASTTPASVNTKAAIWRGPSGSCSATADTATPITGTAVVPIAATEAGSRASAANQLR